MSIKSTTDMLLTWQFQANDCFNSNQADTNYLMFAGNTGAIACRPYGPSSGCPKMLQAFRRTGNCSSIPAWACPMSIASVLGIPGGQPDTRILIHTNYAK
ncbi:MAG: hypothetical protein GY806_11405 [Gammaproteobacteria bacterium]|nr:hypothetical protein [Gammaproteobacteria bacterium]